MEDEPHGVVEEGVVGEGVVAALVGDDPDAGEDAALEDPVQRPGGKAERGGWNGRDEVKGEEEEDGGDEEIVEDVGEGTGNGAVEAVRRDGFLQLA